MTPIELIEPSLEGGIPHTVFLLKISSLLIKGGFFLPSGGLGLGCQKGVKGVSKGSPKNKKYIKNQIYLTWLDMKFFYVLSILLYHILYVSHTSLGIKRVMLVHLQTRFAS